MAGINCGGKGRKVQCNVDMVVMQIDALDNILQHSTLTCGFFVAERSRRCAGSLDRLFNTYPVVNFDRAMDGAAITQEAAHYVDHYLFEIMSRHTPATLSASIWLKSIAWMALLL